jgi:endoglucanase
VLVHGRDGVAYRGALQPAVKPIHLLDPSEIKPPKLEELFVDLGMPADQVKDVVEIGDMVTLDRTLEQIGDCVVSKALDDRVGVYVMIEAIRSVTSHNAEIVTVATTQEEVGLRGAIAAAYGVEPDISIALDVTLALDGPGGAPEQAVTRLGKGVALKVFDSSHLTHPKLLRHFRDLAEEEEIPYQLEILPRGGTDAGAMQVTRTGTVAVTLSIPTRYVHTVNEMANTRDIDATVRLLTRYLEDAGKRDYSYEMP